MDKQARNGAPAIFAAGRPARWAALAWWAAHRGESARCDGCCRPLCWGEGYLAPRRGRRRWLLCEACMRAAAQ